eukprot:CAMPEP_0194265086 /NCGR_PEP_ID=MMETSP0169-20130528/427_1 /TAXON_ID=218684 /ORGANISM="Corethron pennatum, Strain L29A3" /LENGTH=98 /DNA_ID=CAMNT_0039005479 /DNA_START=620 /DNA_END=919 /DNA_ORIENTATION=-
MASMQIRPCLSSAHRAYLRSVWISDIPMGSKPTSPGMVPSSLSGRTRKGRDFDMSPLRVVAVRIGWAEGAKAEALARAAATRRVRIIVEKSLFIILEN